MIGDKLREERERQKLSIKDIEKGTSIRSLYIDAIEKGDYKTLPGEVYTKGFIRNYANFLKLDADAAVKQFNEENHPEREANADAQPVLQTDASTRRDSAALAHRMTRDASAAAQREDDFARRVEDSHHRQTLLMGAIAAIVVLVGGYFLFGISDEPQAAEPKQTTQQSVKATAKQQASTEESAVRQQATEVRVSAKFTGRCWVSVKADGEMLFEGTIEKGETKEWKADERLDITAGNAGAVSVTYNGESQGALGDEGEVVERTYRLHDAEGVAEESVDTEKK